MHAFQTTIIAADAAGSAVGSSIPADSSQRDLGAEFDRIYKAHGDRVLHLIYRFTRREDVAADLLQDVFVKVYQNLHEFRNDADPFTWIYRITVNHVLNHLKKEKRSKVLRLMDKKIGELFPGDEQTSAFEGVDDRPLPDAAMEQSEREKIIREALDSMPVKYRVPFMLFRYEEMSYNEICAALNLSLSAVETRIHRAKKLLIKRLEPWIEHI